MTSIIDFIFDFASPNAYFSYKALKGIEERTGAQVNYIPCLLGGIFKATGNQAPMIAFGNIKNKLEYEMLEIDRFIKKHDINQYTFNSHFPINTLLMMRAAIAAEQDGRLVEYIGIGLKLIWEHDKKMDDPEVFVTSMTENGFDGATLLERTQDPAIKSQLIQNTESAVERGAFGIPTFYLGKEMFFGKDRLQQLEEEIVTHQ